jgi:glycosyltransferase involved in cell wall biosynthesis
MLKVSSAKDMTMPNSDPQPTQPEQIGLAIISNGLTPYRVHLHRRIAREMPQVRLYSVLTHEDGTSAWSINPPPEIGTTRFSEGQSSTTQSSLRYALREFRKGGRIIEWMKRQRIKAVVVLGYNDAGRVRIIRWCRRHGVACFLWGDSNIRSEQVAGIKAVIKEALVGWIIRNCAGVMPCGTYGTQYFKKYGATDDRIFLFPNEPDYNLIWNIPASAVDAVRGEYNFNPSRRRIVFSGRLVKLKRVELLIEAFLSIAATRPDWDLVIVGDGPMRSTWEAMVPENLQNRTHWIGFVDDQAKIGAIYQACDILCLTSDYEAWSLVVMEAAAAGLAIVTSDVVGASADLIVEGDNGFIFKSGDVAHLSRALMSATDPVVVDKLKEGSRRVLGAWRNKADPVAGLTRALEASGVLK